MNGNLTSDGSNTCLYDVENRLVSAPNATLRYDPLGRLYEVPGSSGTTRFLYDGDALVAEFNASGTMLRSYIHGTASGDDPLVWFELASMTSAGLRHLLSDERGSIVGVTDANGNTTMVNSYDSWGIPAATNLGRFQFSGGSRPCGARARHDTQAWIPELGMYHYKARIYSPTLGRFLQTDPIGYEDTPNLYAYVGNDPVNAVDPTGESGIGHNGGPPLDDVAEPPRILPWLGRAAGALVQLAWSTPAGQGSDRIADLRREDEARNLSSRIESRSNSLDVRHRDAAVREGRGEVVARRPDGRPFDHRQEIAQTANGLRRDIANIDRRLADPRTGSGARQILQAARGRASRLLDVANRTLRRAAEEEARRAARSP